MTERRRLAILALCLCLVVAWLSWATLGSAHPCEQFFYRPLADKGRLVQLCYST